MSSGQSILIVDDDEDMCRSLALILGRKGYEIEVASTGQDAIREAQGRFFNATLLDIRLPDMEGTELLARFKEMHPDMVMIMVTGHASLETALQALNQGASAYITKPPNMDEVLSTISESLEKQHLVMENRRLLKVVQQELAERKRMESALEEERALLARRIGERTADLSIANAELARANRMKDEFLASMSHELRTPLTAILGVSEALQENVYGPMNENQLKSLRTVEESGRHLLALINDILDVSKIEADELKLEIEQVFVKSICQSSLQLIKQNAQKKRLRVSSSIDSAVTTLQADQRRLKQILVNLLSNAVKFTPEGGEIGLEVVGDVEQEAVRFIVWDTGIGIPQKQMPRLFQPFVQLNSSLSRQYTGTGLGLALVHRLVDMHSGSVLVESEVGKGSRFTVSLPWSGSTETVKMVEEVELGGTDALELSPVNRALIVDDSRSAAEQVARYLAELGVDSVVHDRGEGAVDRALDVQPDLIILNILLPDLTGWDVLTQLKAEPLTHDIPVIIISSMDDRQRGLELGAAEYLVKPISRQQFQQRLSEVLPVQATESAALVEIVDEGSGTEEPLILLAEDNENSINTVSDYLLAAGYRVIVARDGKEVVQRAREEGPDLILMDIQMSGMDGLEAIRRIRGNADLADVPIIALTALAMPGDCERCLEAGANDYISKPFSLKGLARTIRAHLNQDQEEGDALA